MTGTEYVKTKSKKWLSKRLLTALVLPVGLIGLFYAVIGRKAWINRWVYGVMAPVEQWLGRFWAWAPFSVAEVLAALFLAGSVLWLLWTGIDGARRRDGRKALNRILVLAAAWLWLWCGLCWFWNGAYYADTFAQRAGLKTEPYSVDDLACVTAYFAQQAAALSDQVTRNDRGSFSEDLEGCFAAGEKVYEDLTREFPCINIEAVQAKPLVFSRLQSILGFTGVYFPFTGEANVNVDAPACLVPATIAHEMAHQRMVASELEANFVGIAACVTSDDVVFQYSGYLMGLIQLCNALYPVDAQAWKDIVQEFFTPELAVDWNENNAYWDALRSPVEDAAEQVYDSFLKGNGQELGMRSYDACVDLLVSYFKPMAEQV